MRISCFCAARGNTFGDADEAPRPGHTRRTLGRHASVQSASSSRRSTATTNTSISKLPPCKRVSDPKIEAMMMPSPPELRPSKCLRLSSPKTYSAIVDSMKASRGCRDWRSFDVFDADDIDSGVSAVEVARRRAADCERKIRALGSSSSYSSPSLSEVDMIG